MKFGPYFAAEPAAFADGREPGSGSSAVAGAELAVISIDAIDDVPDDTSTTAAVSVGGSYVGEISPAGDSDWISVTLTAGNTYTIKVAGADTGEGTLVDPTLVGIYDSAGDLIFGTSNDDDEGSHNSATNFSPLVTGTYYISASGFEAGLGTYTVLVSDVTAASNDPVDINTTPTSFFDFGFALAPDNALIAGLLEGSYFWQDPSNAITTITVSFPQAGATFSTDPDLGYGPVNGNAEPWVGLSGLTAVEQSAFQPVLGQVEDLTNINFEVIPENSNSAGEIRIAWTDFVTEGAAAWAYFPYGAPFAADIWLSEANFGDSSPGTRFNKVLLHELGHALGLKHPEDNFDPFPVLDPAFDGANWTVMSTKVHSSFPTAVTADLEPQTFMYLDILALQYLYGADFNSSSGDDTYVFDGNLRYYMTLWDTGGNDTLDFTNNSHFLDITIAPDSWLDVGTVIRFEDATGGSAGFTRDTVYIPPEVIIENVIGGSRNDIITGNDADNVIEGRDGQDQLFGGSGNDTLLGGVDNDILTGGAGSDTINGGSGSDTASYVSSLAGVQVILLSSAASGGDADGDVLTNIENLSGSNFEDFLRGDDGNNILTGNAGDDILEGGLGVDTLDGGDGFDAASYVNATSGVSVDLSRRRGIDGEASGDILNRVENIIGSDFDDILVGLDLGIGATVAIQGISLDLISQTPDTRESMKSMLALENGGYLLVWSRETVPDGPLETVGQFFSAANDALTGEIILPDFGTIFTMTELASGKILIAQLPTGSAAETSLYKIDPTDSSISAPIELENLSPIGELTALPDGGFIVGQFVSTIEANRTVTNFTVQLLDADGTARSTPHATGSSRDPVSRTLEGHIVVQEDGSFLVVLDVGRGLLRGQVYNKDGEPVGDLFDVLGPSGEFVKFSAIDPTGGFVAFDSGTDTFFWYDDEGILTGRSLIIGSDLGGSSTALNFFADGSALVFRNLAFSTGLEFFKGVVAELFDPTGQQIGQPFVLENPDNGTSTGITLLGSSEILFSFGVNLGSPSFETGIEFVQLNAVTAAADTTFNSNLLVGGGGNDILHGLGGNDQLIGGNGDDTLIGGSGADVLDGGAGNDTASYAGSSAGVTVKLWNGSASGGHATGDALTSIENLVGSNFNDTLVGDGRSNLLQGGGGNDRLFAGGGDDILEGGTGADKLDGGAGDDTASYVSSAAAVTVKLWNGTGAGGDAEGDSLNSIENLIGSAFNDTLVGNNGVNILEGGGGDDRLFGSKGNDTLEGGVGADRLDGGAGSDTASYAGSASAVTVKLWNGTGTGGDAVGDNYVSIENLIGSAFNDTLVGNNADNILKGGGGNDRLFGGAGNDTLEGGAGNNLLDGGAGRDTVSYEGSSAGVTVKLWNGSGSGGDAAGDALSGIENLIGSSFNDTFSGNNAKNLLQGDGGNDRLFGGRGNDTLEGGAGADKLFGGEGADTVSYAGSSAGVTVKLWNGTGAGGEAQGDTLSEIENITGSRHNDTLSGDSGVNRLEGGAGNDRLFGGNGDDILRGGAGNDRLFGQAGADTFVFDGTWGDDTIADFEDGSDLLDFSGSGLAFGDLTISQVASDTLIEDAFGNSITLTGITATDIAADDFLF